MQIENKTIDEIKVGDRAALARVLSDEDIALFAAVSGDVNPAHLDPEFARTTLFKGVIAHGLWGAGLISAVLGVQLPGPGTIYLGQTLSFRRPIHPGETVRAEVEVTALDREKGKATLSCRVYADGEIAIEGEARVLAPRDKIRRPGPGRLDAKLVERPRRFRELVAAAAESGTAPVPGRLVGPLPRAAEAGLARAIEAGLLDLDAADPWLTLTDQLPTHGDLVHLIDAPLAHGPIAVLATDDAPPGVGAVLAALGLDAADVLPLDRAALSEIASGRAAGVLRAPSPAAAALFAQTLDILGGAAAITLAPEPAGRFTIALGADPDGLETCAGVALLALASLRTRAEAV